MATKIQVTFILADGTRWVLPNGVKSGGKTTYTIKQESGTLVAVKSVEAKTVTI